MIINDKPPNTMNPEHCLHSVTMRIFISSSVHVTLSAVGNQRVLPTTLILTCECWIVYATIGGVTMELATIQSVGNAFCHIVIAVGYVMVSMSLYESFKRDRK